jgi:hypothetical protein
VNEYLNSAISREAIESWYLEAYRTLRTATCVPDLPTCSL